MEAPDLEQDRWDVAATKYYAMSVLKMSDQLRHEVVAPQVPAEVVANGAVMNEAVRIAAIERQGSGTRTPQQTALSWGSNDYHTSYYKDFTQALTMSPFNNGLKNLFKQNKFTKISELAMRLLRPGPAGANDDVAPRANS
ncbi:hypothetical protein BC829DRAFT_442466 [Chytridium lagenaria]|nr:hypothetical protein BC829DRAFT_442466 [Chytridium lagenaria]